MSRYAVAITGFALFFDVSGFLVLDSIGEGVFAASLMTMMIIVTMSVSMMLLMTTLGLQVHRLMTGCLFVMIIMSMIVGGGDNYRQESYQQHTDWKELKSIIK